MLRIITGTAKNKELKVPVEGTRPMTDRAKSSLFSMLNSKIKDSEVLDLFAGSGALGLESLSRGAKKAVFLDIAKESIDCIEANIKTCEFTHDRYEIFKMDALDYLVKLAKKAHKLKSGESIEKGKFELKFFDLIFITPPYKQINEETIRLASRILNKDGILITDCPIQETLPNEIGPLVMVEKRQYGKFDLYFYLHKEYSDSLG